MSDIVTPIDTLLNDDLKWRLDSQISLEDWTDECSKCGYPKLLHKDHVLHRDAACNRGAEVPNILKKNWKVYTQRVKPLIRMLRDEAIEEKVKEKEQGVLLQGLRELIDSNTENIKSLLNVRKQEHSPQCIPLPIGLQNLQILRRFQLGLKICLLRPRSSN